MPTTAFHIFSRSGSPNWWMWWYAPDGRQIRKATRYPKARYTREQAQDALDNAEVPDAGGVTRALTVKWLRDHIAARLEAEDRSDGTMRQYRNAFAYLADAVGEEFNLRLLDRSIVWSIKVIGFREGIKPVTINTRLAYLHAAFGILVREDILEANPFRNFERVRERSSGGLPKHLTLDQAKSFLAAVDAWPHDIGRRLIRMVMYTGLRRREVLEIERDDIDLANSRLRAMNIKSRDHHKRWLPIPPQIREHVEWFLHRYPRATHPFRRCHPDTLSDWTKARLIAAGFPSLSTKSLRHTFATLSLEHGIPIRELQRHLDHSDIRITEIYAHDMPDGNRSFDIGL